MRKCLAKVFGNRDGGGKESPVMHLNDCWDPVDKA